MCERLSIINYLLIKCLLNVACLCHKRVRQCTRILNKQKILSLLIIFVFTNSVDPDEMSHYAAFHLDLHCLLAKVQMYVLRSHQYEPVCKILVLIACVNSERSDEPARPRSLVRAFAHIHTIRGRR